MIKKANNSNKLIQGSLFAEDNIATATSSNTSIQHIVVKNKSSTSDKNKMKFYRLIEKIEKEKQTLKNCEDIIEKITNTVQKEMLPLEAQKNNLIIKICYLIDSQLDKKVKLGKKDLAVFITILAMSSEFILSGLNNDSPEYDKIIQIHDRYSEYSYAEKKSEMDNELKEQMKYFADRTGIDMSDFNTDDPDEIKKIFDDQYKEIFDDLLSKSDPGAANKYTNKNEQKLNKKREKEEAEIKQSVRDIYRKLAGELHPDRENDEKERARKNEIMQRVNQAYQNNDILQLLNLQLEIEQIDEKFIESVSTERVKSYINILNEQYQKLCHEVSLVKEKISALSNGSTNEKQAIRTLNDTLSQLQNMVANLELIERVLVEEKNPLKKLMDYDDELYNLYEIVTESDPLHF